MKILLLGSTGSIGKSTCQCVRRFRDEFELVGLSTNSNAELLAEQVREFNIRSVCVCTAEAARRARHLLPDSVTIYEGNGGLLDLINRTECDVVLNALVGAAGFRPTVTALKRNLRVALANKESLVVGGTLITRLLAEDCGTLIPVDSEHSAILQCLTGEDKNTIESITITASGGPFREKKGEEFASITPKEALKHPTWSMGSKITIDSSTLMNKGFEVIEAHHLFGIPYRNLQVVIHPQSIVHSMVTFHDGAVMAQCGIPDMELPIQYALSYPRRMPISSKRLDLTALGTLCFYPPDFNKFPCLRLCLNAGEVGGTLPAVLNAANELAVHAFLNGTIGFNRIAQIIEKAMNDHVTKSVDSVEMIEEIDIQTRRKVSEYIHTIS